MTYTTALSPSVAISTTALELALSNYTDTILLNAQTGTTYTMVLADRGKLVTMSNASANTFTFPQNSAVAIPIGGTGMILQLAAGTTSLAAGTGATVNSRGGLLNLAGQYAAATWVKIATNQFWITGDLA